MLSCREMSELGSEIVDGHLTLRSRIQVMMHLRMCTRCKLYIKQLKLTAQVLQQLPLEMGDVDAHSIASKLKKPDQ